MRTGIDELMISFQFFYYELLVKFHSVQYVAQLSSAFKNFPV